MLIHTVPNDYAELSGYFSVTENCDIKFIIRCLRKDVITLDLSCLVMPAQR